MTTTLYTPDLFAAPPGTGPDGETCKTCKHICRIRLAKNYYKCFLIKHLWKGSKRTDVLTRSPACNKWEPDTPEGVIEKRAEDFPKQAPGFSRPSVPSPVRPGLTSC